MKLRFEPALVQELVSGEVLRDLAFRELARSRLEPVYELPLEERGERFAQTYLDLFQERGLGAVVAEEIARFPLLSRLEEVLVFKSQRLAEEGAELSRDRRFAGIRLGTGRWSHPEPLRAFLRHELMHISDILDEAFGYRIQGLGETLAEEELYRQRYRLLWDVHIDGRLEQRGLEGEAGQEARQAEWERAFSLLPARVRREAFYHLWRGEGITHSELVDFAQQPARLAGEGFANETLDGAPVPGAPCPLCRFPSYAWGDPIPVLGLIKVDFPVWEPAEGACLRCVELYRLRAGIW